MGAIVVSKWRFRDGSEDRQHFLHALDMNEYRIPGVFEDHEVVIDAGAHVGGFSILAARRGARVVPIEADPNAAPFLRHNLEAAGVLSRVCVMAPLALGMVGWRVAGLRPEWPNTAGTHIASDPSTAAHLVPSCGLDEVLQFLPDVSFLKIDIEGSEFEVLESCRLLGRVRAIAGEWHAWGGTWDRLKAILERAGFRDLTFEPHEWEADLGLFWGKR